MDLKEIIKWFIPCFHLILNKFLRKTDVYLTLICLFLFFLCPTLAAKVNRVADPELSLSQHFLNSNDTKNLDLIKKESYDRDQSELFSNVERNFEPLEDTSVGRTFGRPFKKLLQALIPLAFQLGSAATWAVVAALVGIKTLAVTLFIVKLLLVAGAAKIGALFASKGHESHGWSQHPQKEIHLHIHNNGHQSHGTEHESISPWNRDGVQNQAESKHVNVVYDPYAGGPQTISTPYGHYMRIEPGQQPQ